MTGPPLAAFECIRRTMAAATPKLPQPTRELPSLREALRKPQPLVINVQIILENNYDDHQDQHAD